MESTLHTLHRLISSLNSISFSEFGFLVLMGGSAPLNPPITVGDWCDTDMPPDAFCPYPTVADCNLFPWPPAGGQGEPRSQNPHGRKPVGEKTIFENGKPKTPIPNRPIWSTHITLWYAPSKRASGFTPRRQREWRADTRERIIRLRSGRQQYGDEAACYDVTNFFKPYTYFEILYFYP